MIARLLTVCIVTATLELVVGLIAAHRDNVAVAISGAAVLALLFVSAMHRWVLR